MTVTEYSKVIEKATLTFEGNEISSACKSFLSGILERNINIRMSFEQATNHPWFLLIKEKVEEVFEKFQDDSEKMVAEFNKLKITDDLFKNKFIIDLEISKGRNENLSKKKRKRSTLSNDSKECNNANLFNLKD